MSGERVVERERDLLFKICLPARPERRERESHSNELV